jgi:lysophospholipase L1-like esterase
LGTLLVTGDSMSMPLDRDLAAQLSRDGVRVIRDPHAGTGISKTFGVDWVALSSRQVERYRPDGVVIFIGANEGFPLADQRGRAVRCCGAAWTALYASRARRMAYTYRRHGATRVYWVTIPTPREAARRPIARAVNAAIAIAAQPWGGQVRVIDTVPIFTPGGTYRDSMSVGGTRTVVRESDGIHLSAAGSSILAKILLGLIANDFTYRRRLASSPGPTPPCFGAASRDPRKRCVNTSLTFRVVPSVADAQITPGSPCRPLDPTLNVCGFGLSPGEATATIALVGDSHAGAWRAAVDVVAKAKGWTGLSLTRAGCPFSRLIGRTSGPLAAQCVQWINGVLNWFSARPEVSNVFVIDHASRPAYVTARKRAYAFEAEVRGYVDAWRALPVSVRHIVVIRDNPQLDPNTLGCIESALARHAQAGLVCAVPRRRALIPDPEVAAAARLPDRVQVVDLTSVLCDGWLCYPVIGGALVFKDQSHLTRVFAETLGPVLLDAFSTLVSSWSPVPSPGRHRLTRARAVDRGLRAALGHVFWV